MPYLILHLSSSSYTASWLPPLPQSKPELLTLPWSAVSYSETQSEGPGGSTVVWIRPWVLFQHHKKKKKKTPQSGHHSSVQNLPVAHLAEQKAEKEKSSPDMRSWSDTAGPWCCQKRAWHSQLSQVILLLATNNLNTGSRHVHSDHEKVEHKRAAS